MMTEYASDYGIDELMVLILSKELNNGNFVQLGAGSPLATVALLFARSTNAPELTMFIYGAINPEIEDASETLNPSKLYHRACGFMPHEEMNYLIENQRPDLQFIRPVQIDKYGNINGSVIGSYENPKMRFFSIALPDVVILTKRIILYTPEHSKRVFREKLDFISGAGHPEDGKWRERMLIKTKGPDKVITNMCVMGFDDTTKRMKLESLHPGVSVEQVLENTEFDLMLPPKILTSMPPTVNEIKLLREKVDPFGVRKLDFKDLREETMAKLAAKGK